MTVIHQVISVVRSGGAWWPSAAIHFNLNCQQVAYSPLAASKSLYTFIFVSGLYNIFQYLRESFSQKWDKFPRCGTTPQEDLLKEVLNFSRIRSLEINVLFVSYLLVICFLAVLRKPHYTLSSTQSNKEHYFMFCY